jgi:hypothetical protein
MQVADLRLTLFPGDHQVGDGKTVTPTLREAVECAYRCQQEAAACMGGCADGFVCLSISYERLHIHLVVDDAPAALSSTP